jgi:hypothetical protein
MALSGSESVYLGESVYLVHAEKCNHIIPRDTALNKSIMKHITAVKLLRAIKKQKTQFFAALFRREDSIVLSLVIAHNDDAVLRAWFKVMTGINDQSSASIFVQHLGHQTHHNAHTIHIMLSKL